MQTVHKGIWLLQEGAEKEKLVVAAAEAPRRVRWMSPKLLSEVVANCQSTDQKVCGKRRSVVSHCTDDMREAII